MMRKTAPFLGLALALILASCGGGNNSSASNSSVEESTGEASSSENASSSSSSSEATEVVTSWERNRAYLNYLSILYCYSTIEYSAVYHINYLAVFENFSGHTIISF